MVETTLNVNPSKFSQIAAAICFNQTFTTVGGQIISIAGVYTDTLTSTLACDSVVETTLNVNPTKIVPISVVICSNETYTTVGGQNVTTAGIYTDTLSTALTCDSVVVTTLTINQIKFKQLSEAICGNDTFTTAGGQKVTLAGVYTDTIFSVLGCDSIVETILSITPVSTIQLYETICSNDSFITVGGQVISVAGVYTDTFPGWLGCDSLILTNLSINPLAGFNGIVGPDTVDKNLNMIYSINNFSGYNYQWTIVGGTFLGSSTGPTIMVNWNTAGLGEISVSADDPDKACEYDDLLQVYVNELVSINEITEGKTFDFNIIPNPNKGRFAILFDLLKDDQAQVMVYSLKGELLFNKTHNNNGSNLIDMDLDLAQGAYLIRVTTNTDTQMKRLIIQ